MARNQKQFEPLLLVPIAFGGLLSNIPLAGIAEPNGFWELFTNLVSTKDYFH